MRQLVISCLVLILVVPAMGQGRSRRPAGPHGPNSGSAAAIHRTPTGARPSPQHGTGRLGMAGTSRFMPAEAASHQMRSPANSTRDRTRHQGDRRRQSERPQPPQHDQRQHDQRQQGQTQRGQQSIPLGTSFQRPDPNRQALRHELSNIDKMRDRAMQNGDRATLNRADRMEREVRQRYSNHRPGNARHELQNALPTESEMPAFIGPGYGRQTAEQARTMGRDFGQTNANQFRQRQHEPANFQRPAYAPQREMQTGMPIESEMPTFIGPGYGRQTAEQARTMRRDFGQTNANQVRQRQQDPANFQRPAYAPQREMQTGMPVESKMPAFIGPGYGRQTAEQARAMRRDFGQTNANQVRQRQQDPANFQRPAYALRREMQTGMPVESEIPAFIGPGYGRQTAEQARMMRRDPAPE